MQQVYIGELIRENSLRKLERNRMSHMHTITTRPPPRIQKKAITLLKMIQNQSQIPVAEDHAPSQQSMRLVSCYSFEFLQHRDIDAGGAEGGD